MHDMITIIIFTRVDFYTRPYFINIFPSIDFGQYYEFSYLSFIAADKQSQLIFISDEIPNIGNDNLLELLNSIATESQVTVYYHLSQRNYIDSHKTGIRNILPKGFVELLDHHRGDESKHFSKVVALGNTLRVGNQNEYCILVHTLNLHNDE